MADDAAKRSAVLAGARVPDNIKQEIIQIAKDEHPRVRLRLLIS